jgi:hypothetical protein
LFSEGQLTEQAILRALMAGEQDLVSCALAVRADVSLERVNKIIATQSAKGMVSLCWKAGLSVAAAVSLQTKLAKVPPPDIVRARPGTSGFPMPEEEMLWQLEFFAAMVGDVKPDG